MTLDHQRLLGSGAIGALGWTFDSLVAAMAFAFVASVAWSVTFLILWEARGDRA